MKKIVRRRGLPIWGKNNPNWEELGSQKWETRLVYA
jgi:hypothetical protein